MTRRQMRWSMTLAALAVPSLALADDGVAEGVFVANNVWMMVCTALVFIMHMGFSTLESGLTRSKNTVNVLFKNVFIICMGLLTYYVVGFNLMYPGDSWIAGKFLGFGGFGLTLPENGVTPDYASGGYTYWTDFLFQGMFAATAATIISGAVAERVKLWSFMVAATFFVAFVYPIAGSWHWGAGFIKDLGFHDFAGSTLVHSVGGWGALVAAKMLGPRIGKYSKDGTVNPIQGSSMPSATIGALVLWLGWFGFNGGSVLSADPAGTSYVLVNTCLAAAAGGLGAIIGYAFVSKKPDLSMALNGILAGLVGITAGADVIAPLPSILVGFLAGVIVVYSVIFFDKIKIDDPVGATSVHLVCGVFGTLMVGVFGEGKSFGAQAIGVGAYAAFTIAASVIIFGIVKATMGLRVDPEEEIEGLDAGEHGMHAYVLEDRGLHGHGIPASAAAETSNASSAIGAEPSNA
jgi:Amt family ammonium transporter